MMEKDPRKRIQTAAEVVTRLAPWAIESIATGDFGQSTAPNAERPTLPPMGGGLPGLFDDLSAGTDESSSQILQRTDAIASSGHETLPDLEPAPGLIAEEAGYSLALVLVVFVPLLLAAALLVGSVVLKAFL
jgi:hypothetical protein